MPNEIQPLAYGSEDACRKLGIKRSTFFKLLKSGDIRTIRLSGKLLVTQAEIERVIASAEQVAAAKAS
ncbi:MAG: helix-turn-helix domain-containing protein [Hyphomicrobiales bacterium]|nr:helix-turn-helix domain-containing protein [Hyphomicrobiales bacterium]